MVLYLWCTCRGKSHSPIFTVKRPLGRNSRRIGSPTWPPKPSKPYHTFQPETCHNGFWYSHLEEVSFPLVRPHPLGRPGQPRWLAPQGQGRRGVGGTARNLPEPSMTF